MVQTVCQLEDEFDVDAMMAGEQTHKQRMNLLSNKLHEGRIDAAVFTSGSCTLCAECTYPDAPCRHPQRRLVSMEAAGLLVSNACELSGVSYDHGVLTLAYTGCILV